MIQSIQAARVILASSSPRRSELLAQVGIPFTVIPSTVDERLEPGIPPEEFAKRLAVAKAAEVAALHPEADVVIGADTIVVLGSEILGKPQDAEEAVRMLEYLSGRGHEVMTGWALVDPKGEREIAGCSRSRVEFYPLDRETILRYVASREPLDKAGAYAIQGKAGMFVKAIEGDYAAIVGLPISAIGQALRQFGWHVI